LNIQTPIQRNHIFKELTDDELVIRFLKEKDDNIFRVLVERHHDRLFSRFISELKNRADATDIEQQLWLKVFRSLNSYHGEGKFAEYLSRIAGNLLKDFWRSNGRRADVFVENQYFCDDETSDDLFASFSESATDCVKGGDQESELINNEQIQYLVSVLIPSLAVEQRMAWLLRHESEYWESDQRLEWHHLAALNGLGEDEAWSLFETARNKLMSTLGKSKTQSEPLLEEEALMFTVWTQAQRLSKKEQYTWEYFAQLLDVPANTMKTRYRTAQKILSDGLKAYMSQ